MIGITDEKEMYLAHFARLQKLLAGEDCSWLAGFRRTAIERFAALGFPTTRQEEWRRTSVAPIAEIPFDPAPERSDSEAARKLLDAAPLDGTEAARLVFVDGVYAGEHSSIQSLPERVRADSLARVVLSDRNAVEPHLGSLVSIGEQAFPALNTAFFRDGAFLLIPPGAVIEQPLYLVFISTFTGRPTVSHPRVLIVAGERSQAAIVEIYTGPPGGPLFTNAVTEITVGPGALLEHTKYECEGPGTFHIAALKARLGRDSVFASRSFSLGGSLVRNDLDVVLSEPGANATLDGLFIARGRQHMDNHTVIDHAAANGTSRELYKGILGGSSRGVFDGRIIVRKDAQKTDARQVNRNLLLSDEALIDTKPQLEINADDVKCSHAATIGRLDEEAIFYLRSRGLDREEARALLIHAFAIELIERIKVIPIRSRLEEIVFGLVLESRQAKEGA